MLDMTANVIKNISRKSGFTKFIKKVPETFGYNLVPNSKTTWSAWEGLEKLPIRSILDIGASNGSLANKYFIPKFKDAHIHCFEPSIKSFHDLEIISKRSNGRMTAHNFGLGDEDTKLTFNVTSDAPTASSILKPTDNLHKHYPQTSNTEQIEVRVKVLDDIADKLFPKLEPELLIKVDVQGYEERVILGGQHTFSKASACIIEITNENFYEGQPSFERIYELMNDLGFEFMGILDQQNGPQGKILYYDSVFLKNG